MRHVRERHDELRYVQPSRHNVQLVHKRVRAANSVYVRGMRHSHQPLRVMQLNDLPVPNMR